MKRDIHIRVTANEIPGLTIDCPEFLSLKKYNTLLKYGAELIPELIPGSRKGTILESNPDVAELKINPTVANWSVFLTKNDWVDFVPRLVKSGDLSWIEAYAITKTFTDRYVWYAYPVTKDSFCDTSFLHFPKAMNNILKSGYLNCDIKWESLNCLSLEATLDYPDHYGDYDTNMKVLYWSGMLDRNGFLKGKLQLHQSETETYS